MVDPVSARLWGYRALFVALIGFLAMLRLLPLGTVPGSLPWPDLMLAMTFAWVLRRPSYVPAVLIVGLFVMTDLLFQRPPGLYAMLVLLGAEFLRAKQALSRELSFAAEWALVAGVLAAIVAVNHLILSLLLVQHPPLGLAVLRAVFTAMIYPLVVALCYFGLNIRKASAEEVAALGARL